MRREAQNDFLVELLALQQDGKYSISAPSNWAARTPLLEIETEVDEIIGELERSSLSREGENDTARWHFFVGSPGNGKSAAMGKLCRHLLAGTGTDCRICDEQGTPIQQLGESDIPYAVDVYEGQNKFVTVKIVQDASVVRNPFSPEVDPAAELLQTLEECWQKGISLIICTNRGVLEKAHRDRHMDHDVNSRPWFKILRSVLLEGEAGSGKLPRSRVFDGKKTVFKEVEVTYSQLDNRSLLLGQDTLDRIMQKAIAPINWNSCKECSVNDVCPFKANRDWLEEPGLRQRVLQLLTRAEVFSGQVIVLREALALVSLILAGCPRDYNEGHPCDWVRSKSDSGDIFSLLARRIYMCLFGAYYPHGLEDAPSLRNRQLEAMERLLEVIPDEDSQARSALEHVIRRESPSTDVGVSRLVGKHGIMTELDPCREARPIEFYESWDLDSDVIDSGEPPRICSLEKRSTLIWKNLEEAIEAASEHWAPDAYWAVRRWSSNYLLRLGASIEGACAWQAELDDFAELVRLASRPRDARTLQEKKKIRELNKRLEDLLDSVGYQESGGAIRLSDNVTLAGEWVKDNLRPEIEMQKPTSGVSLAIKFGDGEHAVLGAPMYLWLTRRAAGRLDHRCFPRALLTGAMDARVRAAAKGEYAFENNDVEIIIEIGDGKKFKLARIEGEVDVQDGQ